jgi:CubicO group peptidase (beta-lactamase class C family)
MMMHFVPFTFIVALGFLLLHDCSGQEIFHSPLESTSTDDADAVNVYVPWNFNSGSEQVWYGNHLWWENYVGKRSYEFNANFTYDSQYRICSNSKLFTSVSILQLVENGIISSIYDDINMYLDESDLVAWGFPAGTTQYCPTVHGQTQNICELNQNMTFASLLSMQSGIIAAITCSYNSTQWEYQYCIANEQEYVYYGSIADTIAMFIQNPLWVAPSLTYNIVDQSNLYSSANENSYFYSNENFIILSYFIEKLSNQSLATYLQENIFDVVELENTFYDPYSAEFLISSEATSEYFFYTTLPFPPSENPSTSSGAYPPFALGSCASIEYNAGFQAGSGGIISTLPDMVKWYSSLFIAQNTSVLTKASINLILYPWAISSNFPQYYGLGSESMYSPGYWSSPPNRNDWSPENMTSVYYMGGSMCTFFTIVIWNSTVNPFGGPDMSTLPVTVAVARNNRILNVTQDAWQTARMSKTGTWNELTQNGDPYFQALGWSDPDCCGATAPSLSDTEYVAFDLAWYFGTIPFGGQPTGQPVASPSYSNSNDDVGTFEMKSGTGATALLTIFLILGFAVTALGFYWLGATKGKLSFPSIGNSSPALAMQEKKDFA